MASIDLSQRFSFNAGFNRLARSGILRTKLLDCAKVAWFCNRRLWLIRANPG